MFFLPRFLIFSCDQHFFIFFWQLASHPKSKLGGGMKIALSPNSVVVVVRKLP